MKGNLLIISAVMVFCLGCNQKPKYVCDPGPDEKCPASGDYTRIKAFQEKYKPPQDEQDEVNGIWMRLQSQPPAGMHWDATKLVYVKNPPLQAPPPPTPAPSAKK